MLNDQAVWNGTINFSQPEVIMSGIIIVSIFAIVTAAAAIGAIRITARDDYRQVPTRRF